MVFDYSYPYSKLRRGRLQDNGMVCPTLTATHGCLLFLEKVVVEGVIYRGVNPSGSKANGVLHQPDNKSSQWCFTDYYPPFSKRDMDSANKKGMITPPGYEYLGVSIHPLNRKMEFRGYASISKKISPALTAHDGKGSPCCVWFKKTRQWASPFYNTDMDITQVEYSLAIFRQL